jgi:glycosyltransferase involved in cell wall biosynthesis
MRSAQARHDLVRFNRNVRILMIAPTPFFGDRGCHVRILEEARALQAHGAEVLVATYHVGRDVPGVTVVRAAPVPWVRRLPVGFSVHKPYLDLLLLATAARAAWRFGPDVVHGHLHEGAALGALVGRLVRRPVVADLQGSVTGEMVAAGALSGRGPLFALARRLERVILGWPTRLLPSSSNYAAELREAWGVPAARILPLSDAVDPEVFRPGLPADDLRERLGLLGKRVAVYLGVLTPYQGIDDLLDAWPAVVAAVPDAHLVLMGHPNEARYREEAARRGLAGSVTLTGRIPYEETPRYLALGDIGVGPKHASTESNGKLLHYMACGLPAVAYEGAVSRELLGEAGTFVPPRDVPRLAAACAALLEDAGERKRRGEALRARVVERFGRPARARFLLDVYRACLQEAEVRR